MTLAAPPRVRTVQRSALTMLVIAGTLNYVDRATLAIAKRDMTFDTLMKAADELREREPSLSREQAFAKVYRGPVAVRHAEARREALYA